MANWSTRRRKSYSSGSRRRPAWLARLTAIAALINALVRVFGLFKKKSVGPSTTRTTSNDDRSSPVGSAPARRPTSSRTSSTRSQSTRNTEPSDDQASGPSGSDGGIYKLFKSRRTDVIVQAAGEVVKILPDDDDDSDGSSKHQKLLVEVGAGAQKLTIRVCHNLDFGRIPVREGDVISFRGEYEWKELGGTIHWTHHDPRGVHEDGWIEHDGKRYE